MREDYSAKARNGRLAALEAIGTGPRGAVAFPLTRRVAVFQSRRVGMLKTT